jgi:hypothetical protein
VRAVQSGLLDDAFQQRGDPGTQCWEFALDDVPDQVEINAEVFVDELVAYPAIWRQGIESSCARVAAERP